MIAVMLFCRTGRWRMTANAWEQEYHWITWTIEPEAAAIKTAADLRAGDPTCREIQRILLTTPENRYAQTW